MAEINLIDKYPKSNRPIDARGRMKLASGLRLDRSDFTPSDVVFEQQLINRVRTFGWEYFDGDRLYGYGGYNYDPRFWQATVKRIVEHYKLPPDAKVLDVGCAKGFFLYDLKLLYPGMSVAGIDISEYALSKAKDEVKPFLTKGSADQLPYPDKSFDLVVSINTVHSLDPDACSRALLEIQRVAKKHSFVVVNAWGSEEEKERLLQWNIAAKTYMHVDEWKRLFDDIGYHGDYFWFFAE